MTKKKKTRTVPTLEVLIERTPKDAAFLRAKGWDTLKPVGRELQSPTRLANKGRR